MPVRTVAQAMVQDVITKHNGGPQPVLVAPNDAIYRLAQAYTQSHP